jgi:hypothetical protein
MADEFDLLTQEDTLSAPPEEDTLAPQKVDLTTGVGQMVPQTEIGRTTSRPFEWANAPEPAPTLDDEGATDLLQRYPSLNAEQRKEAEAKLEPYFAEQDHKAASARMQEREDMLLNPEAKKKFYETPEVRSAAAELDDPNEMWSRHVVTDVLEKDILKRPLLPDEYEAAKNNRIGIGMAGKPKIGDAEALDVLHGKAEEAKKTKDVLTSINPEILEGIVKSGAAGGPAFTAGDVFDKVRKGIPNMTPAQENQLYSTVNEQVEGMKDKINRIGGQAIYSMYDYFPKLIEGTQTPEETKAVYGELLKLSPEDLVSALDTAAAAVNVGKADPGILMRAMTKFRNEGLSLYGIVPTAKGMSNTSVDFQLTDRREALEKGIARMMPNGEIIWQMETPKQQVGLPITPERKAEELQKIDELLQLNQIDRTVRSVFENKVKGVQIFGEQTAYGIPQTIENFYFGAQEQVGPMMLMALSAPAYIAVVGSQSFEQIKLQNPRIDNRTAQGMAAVETVVNWVGDNLQLKGAQTFLATRLTAAFRKLPASQKIARAAILYGAETATEVGQDYFSDVGKRLLQETILQIHPDLDVGTIKKWDEMMSWDQVGQTAGQMFFLVGIGVGALTYRDIKDPGRAVYNDDMLRRTGMSQAKIDTLLLEEDFDARDKLLQETLANLTPEERNNGILYSQEQDKKLAAKVSKDDQVAAAEAGDGNPFVPPTLEAYTRADGIRRFNLLDGEGSVVKSDLTEEIANAEYEKAYQQSRDEWRQSIIDEAASERQAEETHQAEQTWSMLSPQERTSTKNVLKFEYDQRPTPERAAKLFQLQKALTRGGFRDQGIRLATPLDPTTRAGKAAVNFVGWFERTFGKQVVFVASAGGKQLSFAGIVNHEDPNTIFLDVAGNRNVLALLGHEWSHTLETTNKALWSDVMERMKPLVVDWAKEIGWVAQSYSAEQATPEFVANVIGDAFADPDFWKTVRDRHSGLFERMVRAVMDWFDTIIDSVSEWDTQAHIKDLKGMRNLIAQAMETARQGPELAPAGAEAGVSATKVREYEHAQLQPQEVTGFRGEPKGPSTAGQAHGIGAYYGLTEETAQRFSRPGTVKQSNLRLGNPLTVNSDAELRAIRSEAGVNPDPRMLLSKNEAVRFTEYLQSRGHDSFITNYLEASGGKQVIVFPQAQRPVTVEAPAPAPVEAEAPVPEAEAPPPIPAGTEVVGFRGEPKGPSAAATVASERGPAAEREVSVTVFDHELNGFREARQPATKDLAKQLRAEARMYEQLLKCIG